LSGSDICEFAENGTIGERVSPFVHDGKLYFVCRATPANNGRLGKGFEFILSERHKTLGKYRGKQKVAMTSEIQAFVVGFAEAGKITITDVFINDDETLEWMKNAKFAALEESSGPKLSESWGYEFFEPIVEY
jgi:hypothetical protein